MRGDSFAVMEKREKRGEKIRGNAEQGIKGYERIEKGYKKE